MNKKAVIFEMGMWLMRILLVIIIIAAVTLQIRAFVNAKVNLDASEPVLLVQVLGNSPEFLETDHVIYLEKFKNANLDSVLSYKTRHASAKLTLFDESETKIAEIYLNRNYYDELASQLAKLKGKTVVQAERKWPVTIMDDNKPEFGMLRVEVLQPR